MVVLRWFGGLERLFVVRQKTDANECGHFINSLDNSLDRIQGPHTESYIESFERNNNLKMVVGVSDNQPVDCRIQVDGRIRLCFNYCEHFNKPKSVDQDQNSVRARRGN